MQSYSTGSSRIPPELFSYIIHFLVQRITARGDVEKTRKHRKAISGASRTCRFWASKIRPFLFEKLTLRAREDVSDLLSAMSQERNKSESPTSIRSQWIKELSIEYNTGGGFPWLHHVHKLSLELPDAKLLLRMTNQMYSKQCATSPRELDLSLPYPRTIPASMFPFSHIMLEGLRIKHKKDLMCFTSLSRTLEFCQCINITFTEDSPQYHATKCNKLAAVGIFQCGNGRLDQQIYLALHIMNSTTIDFVHDRVINEAIKIAKFVIPMQFHCATNIQAHGK